MINLDGLASIVGGMETPDTNKEPFKPGTADSPNDDDKPNAEEGKSPIDDVGEWITEVVNGLVGPGDATATGGDGQQQEESWVPNLNFQFPDPFAASGDDTKEEPSPQTAPSDNGWSGFPNFWEQSEEQAASEQAKETSTWDIGGMVWGGTDNNKASNEPEENVQEGVMNTSSTNSEPPDKLEHSVPFAETTTMITAEKMDAGETVVAAPDVKSGETSESGELATIPLGESSKEAVAPSSTISADVPGDASPHSTCDDNIQKQESMASETTSETASPKESSPSSLSSNSTPESSQPDSSAVDTSPLEREEEEEPVLDKGVTENDNFFASIFSTQPNQDGSNSTGTFFESIFGGSQEKLDFAGASEEPLLKEVTDTSEETTTSENDKMEEEEQPFGSDWITTLSAFMSTSLTGVVDMVVTKPRHPKFHSKRAQAKKAAGWSFF